MNFPKTLMFNDFIILTKSMFESNPLVVIGTNQGDFKSYEQLLSYLYNTRFGRVNTDFTITSIEVRSISFSIGDTVMIVDTGEIGEIEDIIGGELIKVKSTLTKSYRSHELVKIDSSLLPLLQDDKVKNP